MQLGIQLVLALTQATQEPASFNAYPDVQPYDYGATQVLVPTRQGTQTPL